MLLIYGRIAPDAFAPNVKFRQGSGGFIRTRLNEAEKRKDIDLLFLGSSHCYRGFDTRIFAQHGYNCMNLGSSAQTPLQTEVLVERYLDKLNPKKVIYEVYPGTFTFDGVESALDLISNDEIDSYALNMALKTNNIKVYNTLLYVWLNDVLNITPEYVEPRQKGTSTYVKGGYVEMISKINTKKCDKKEDWKIREEQFEAFKRIINKLKSRNIEIFLVYAPITKSLYSSHTNNSYIDRLFHGEAPYFNFNKDEKFDDEKHFYDLDHLNQEGVELFNDLVIRNVLKKK